MEYLGTYHLPDVFSGTGRRRAKEKEKASSPPPETPGVLPCDGAPYWKSPSLQRLVPPTCMSLLYVLTTCICTVEGVSLCLSEVSRAVLPPIIAK